MRRLRGAEDAEEVVVATEVVEVREEAEVVRSIRLRLSMSLAGERRWLEDVVSWVSAQACEVEDRYPLISRRNTKQAVHHDTCKCFRVGQGYTSESLSLIWLCPTARIGK